MTDHKSLRQKVYDDIMREVVTCKLAPGSSLSEQTFAEQYQVSKTPVREALTALQQVGLVHYTPNRGFMVAPISIRDVQEIFEARIYFETTLFRLAIANITDEHISLLERLADIDDTVNNHMEPEVVIQTNEEFHMAIARIAGNSRLLNYYQTLMNEAQRLTFLDLKESNNEHVWDASHRIILEAMRSGDEEAGIQAIHDVLLKSKRRILKME
jgi:DNA-binding GntR family transcriptional regulator